MNAYRSDPNTRVACMMYVPRTRHPTIHKRRAKKHWSEKEIIGRERKRGREKKENDIAREEERKIEADPTRTERAAGVDERARGNGRDEKERRYARKERRNDIEREQKREAARVKAGGRERRRASACPAEGARRPHMCSETNVRSECRLLPIIRCRGVPLCARGWSADSVPRFYAARQPGPVRVNNRAARLELNPRKPSENPGLRPESRERTSPSSAARPTKRIVCIRGAERVAAGHSPPINEGEARAAPPVF
ncbi:hypothetical protein ALC60_02049 [Trachymyrmex zeteki]|uniref:Uncharacterized protein n=1 Tax=Mycetomoellerius zeteki TaxID=64791 RepID=A0A151XET6_9HYME|nr:hypothetical protein ALC60_02049 [Trachymyrmex zeteki]